MKKPYLFLFLCLGFFSCFSPKSLPQNTSKKIKTPRYDGPVIDVHAHIFFEEEIARSVNPKLLATPDNLLLHTKDSRLSHIGTIVMAPRDAPEETRALNDKLYAFLTKNTGKFFGIASVHPDDGEEALKELERLKQLGMKMLKLHPNTQRFDIEAPNVSAVVKKAGELGLPVLFDYSGALNTQDFGKYLSLAIANPNTQIVLAHMGATRFHEVAILSLIETYPWYQRNIWFDLSAIATLYVDSPYEEELRWVIRKIGVDRVLFGSDFPIRTPLEAIEDVQNLGFTLEEQQQIFYKNAKNLLGITP